MNYNHNLTQSRFLKQQKQNICSFLSKQTELTMIEIQSRYYNRILQSNNKSELSDYAKN